eukprot:TRINITY_DN5510_c0_g1_i1.p1 TRINITY_DN5510_c0_g1~~TRINITY_DN5510_c0_g1_i1.p1  ORF type:complete len:317 (-),score=42.72 TRINITY_DN5510_c0_g1_i1:124-1074(-)
MRGKLLLHWRVWKEHQAAVLKASSRQIMMASLQLKLVASPRPASPSRLSPSSLSRSEVVTPQQSERSSDRSSTRSSHRHQGMVWGTLEHRRARRMASHCADCAAELDALIKWRLKLRMEKRRLERARLFATMLWRQQQRPQLESCLDEARYVLEVSHSAVTHLKSTMHSIKWELWCQKLSGLLATWWHHSRQVLTRPAISSPPCWTEVPDQSYIRAMFLAAAGLSSALQSPQVTNSRTRAGRLQPVPRVTSWLGPSTSYCSGTHTLQDDWVRSNASSFSHTTATRTRPGTPRKGLRTSGTGSGGRVRSRKARTKRG